MESLILIYYAEPGSPRIRYVLDWIFKEQLHLNYELTNEKTAWNSFSGAKINYSNESFSNNELQIKPSGLLFETNIKTQQLSIQRWKKTTIFFYTQPGKKVPFDIFSAIFYLISRYEEYLPHNKDQHKRYSFKQSAAVVYGFLDEPVVDIWLLHFRQILNAIFELNIPAPQFEQKHSFDIDMAWKYLHKGKNRIYGAYLKDFLKGNFKQIKERAAVLKNKITDPYFSFEYLKELHLKYKIDPLYFVLLGKWSTYDRNTPPQNPEMIQLIKNLGQAFDCGIHPSYKSHEDKAQLREEINTLATVLSKSITKSRQHFIKFTLPETYQTLIELGITEDYSMGYAAQNGFRASTSRSFLWYDLSLEKTTELRVHPFAFMDATSKFYLHKNKEQAFQEWLHIYHKIKSVNGVFISIWHNYILSNKLDKNSWMDLYEQVVEI